VPVRFFLDFPTAVGGEWTGTFGLLEFDGGIHEKLRVRLVNDAN
jgi:hypothetical protein